MKKLITKLMLKKGFSPYFAHRTFDNIFKDLLHNKNIKLKEKLWTLKRGFLINQFALLGLTNENFKDYLSYFDYNKLHPINGTFSHFIDDKLSIRYILDPFSEFLPEYYYLLFRGELLKLPDCPKDFEQKFEEVLRLLKVKHSLAVKLLIGFSGQGFIKLTYENDRFSINGELVQEKAIKELMKGLMELGHNGYLVTEFIKPCNEITNIWAKTSNAIRVLVFRNRFQNPIIAESFIRFGTNESGMVDNANAGGVACLLNIDDGTFSGGIIGKEYYHLIEFHPDSLQPLRGRIPNWSFIKAKIIEISSSIPQVICLGFDIIVTNKGFKIIEINSHPDFYQLYMPFLKNDVTKDFYKTLIDRKRLELEHRKNQRLSRRFIKIS